MASQVMQPAARRLPVRVSFWALAATLTFLQFAASTPSPMYGLYQREWRFSAIVLTAVYAANALALLVTLLFVGSLSDHVGRRPILMTAALVELTAMGVLAEARGVGWLVAGRVLQGVATGTASGAISAMLIDLQPPGSRLGALMTNLSASGGIALGALGSGLLVQFAPAPTRLAYWLLMGVFVILLGLVIAMPETVTGDGLWKQSLPPRVSVPPQVRASYLGLLPSIVASWALAGLYLALGPSMVVALSPSASHLAGALLIVAFNGTGVALAIAGRSWSAERALYTGSGLLMTGVMLAMAAVAARQTALLFAGTMVAGAGFGPSFSGALRTLTGLAPAARRAEVVTAIYVAAYLGLSLPAIAAGVAVTRFGLFTTAYGYGSAVVAFTGAAVTAALHGRGRAAAETEPLSPHHELPPCPGSVPALARH
jgi:MFS family permease